MYEEREEAELLCQTDIPAKSTEGTQIRYMFLDKEDSSPVLEPKPPVESLGVFKG